MACPTIGKAVSWDERKVRRPVCGSELSEIGSEPPAGDVITPPPLEVSLVRIIARLGRKMGASNLDPARLHAHARGVAVARAPRSVEASSWRQATCSGAPALAQPPKIR